MTARNGNGSIINTPSNEDALDQVREELWALSGGDILREVRVSARVAVAVVEAAVGRVQPLRLPLIAFLGELVR